MSTEKSALGTCPFCGEDVPAGTVLIEYEKNGGPAVCAECPACGQRVHPQ